MLYLWLKYIHVVSSTLLFGTGIGTASVMLYGHLSQNPAAMAIINRYVVLVDWIYTGSSGIIQPLTGLWMIYLAGYSWKLLWVYGSILGYMIAAACWFPVVYYQIQIRNITVTVYESQSDLPLIYYQYFKKWIILGFIAFTSLICVFYLMVMKTVSF